MRCIINAPPLFAHTGDDAEEAAEKAKKAAAKAAREAATKERKEDAMKADTFFVLLDVETCSSERGKYGVGDVHQALLLRPQHSLSQPVHRGISLAERKGCRRCRCLQ